MRQGCPGPPVRLSHPMGRPGRGCGGPEVNVLFIVHADLEERFRVICMGLPGVTEKLSHGTPAFFVGKQFLTLWLDGHHDHRFPHMWCAAPPGVQDELDHDGARPILPATVCRGSGLARSST